MPRKMAGIAMITIEASIVAIVMLSVVFESAIHLYRPSVPSFPVPFLPGAPPGPFTTGWAPGAPLRSAFLDTLIHATSHQLLDRNYLSG